MKTYCANCGKERTIAIAMPVTPCPDCDSTAIRYPADADAAPATFRADVTVMPQEPPSTSQSDACRCPKCGTQHTPGVNVTITTTQDGDIVPFIEGVPKVLGQHDDEEADTSTGRGRDTMTTREPVLCLVDRNRAWFTTAPLDEQWGDDWNDAPYEHNAGRPYDHKGDITSVFFEGPFRQPGDSQLNSPYSVQRINEKQDIAWLRPSEFHNHDIHIHAGTTLTDFVRRVRAAGGRVWKPLKEEDHTLEGTS